jgi:hypothetical protein
MKRVDLIKVEHNVKIGDKCEYIEPNVTEDSIFYADGEPIGFYLTKMPEKMCKLADLANKEFRSKNVPKSLMARAGKLRELQLGKTKEEAEKINVEQYSTDNWLLFAPKALMRREYRNRSSQVHSVKSAQTFIKGNVTFGKGKRAIN